MTRTRRSVGKLALGGLGAATLGIMALGGASAAPAGVATTLLLRPANWPSHHLGIGAKPHGSTGASTPVGWYSSNWSGYAVTAGAAPFTGITSQWTVPAVARTRNATFSAAWAGIDGFTNSSLIQTGTEQDYYNGAPHYAAWWTTSAQGFAEQPLPPAKYPIAPGDQMSASITETAPGSGTWTILLTDGTSWSFKTSVTSYTGPGTSAEWIIEAPTVNGRLAPLAHYTSSPSSPLTFDHGTVTVGTTTASPNLTSVDGGAMIQGRSIVSVPSVPDTHPQPDGFNMAYGSIAPLPPS